MTKDNGRVPHLYGYKAILAYLREEYGYGVSRHTLWRKSRRPDDPFPMTVRIVERNQCVVAGVVRVRAWAARNIVAQEMQRRDKLRGDDGGLP